MTERIWCANYATSLDVNETNDGLEVTADVGDESTTVVLDATGVRKLRLALARYERKLQRQDVTTE